MSSPSDVYGRQEPRISHLPEGEEFYGERATLWAAGAGLHLDPWQATVLDGSMRIREDGKWGAFEVGLVVPRQQGKGSILEARELFGLFALKDERLIVHSSHEFKTSQEAFNRILGLIQNTPQLEARVAKVTTAHGSEGIELKDGSRLRFLARTAGAGRGFSADLIILDEAFNLPQSAMAAMLPTMAAKSLDGNPQIWYTSSAGMPASEVLEGVRNRAITGDAYRLAYFEWSAPDDADPDDVESIRIANPGLGKRMSLEHVMSEREAMGDEEFKRERLGIWAKVGGETVFAPGVWEQLADEESSPGQLLVFSVDVSPNRDSASIALLSTRADGRVHGEVIENEIGTSWVGHRLGQLQERYNPAAIVVVAGSQAESLIPTWKREGVRVHLIKFVEYVQACGRFFDMVTQGKFVHLNDPVVEAAVAGAKQSWRQDTASWYWSRKNSNVDITPLVALTVAVAGLEKKTASGARKQKVVVM